MAKKSTAFFCSSCGYESAKWVGQCPGCRAWNTLTEAPKHHDEKGVSAITRGTKPVRLHEIDRTKEERISVGMAEFDRVLGGGVVPGSLILIGGDPGVGKSTVVLQICRHLAAAGQDVIYVSGEESERQIRLRSDRIGAFEDGFRLYCETNLSEILATVSFEKPDFLIIDSIQTMVNPAIQGVPGSVSQVKESTASLLNLAKSTGINVLIIGHVTKEGQVAGPRLLEHMVDTVLYIEGERFDNYRLLRGVKNRFGPTNEVGVFEMTSTGLREVRNPSELMLAGRMADAPGSIVACVMEGTRPLLIEIQALVSKTGFGTPRRTAVGVDYNRVNLLIAVIEKRLRIQLSDYDAYVNVVGGMRVSEPSLDLAIILALLSSYYNKPFGTNVVAFGEVGLAGEVRAVSHALQRVQEAKKIGFSAAIIPEGNAKRLKNIEGVKLTAVSEIRQLINQ
ncbi:MAG: DNA repair protein RadA [Eubacteriales bacterium]|nr:DNA repair protein RadA [Eubacteriales bacterium]